jgi:ATP-dependent helicase/nuclease subunit B
MVLRGLLAEKRGKLKLFRASARLTGFASQLSQVLGELQKAGLDPASLELVAARVSHSEALAAKLHDLSFVLREYLNWLEVHHLQDGDALLRAATNALRANSNQPQFETVWVDGFAEFTELELDLLCSLLPFCTNAVVTFCVEPPSRGSSWLSHWTVVKRNFERCRKRFGELSKVEVITENLPRTGAEKRFSSNPVLEHLEKCWDEPHPFQPAGLSHDQRTVSQADAGSYAGVQKTLRLVSCHDRESEVVLAAREILAFVRAGGRYRETSVLLRRFEPYYQLIRRVFSRYQIPFFLDRRESVAHHPLAELTRSAIRVIAFGWQHEDWFAALKSGFAPVADEEIDILENEALARGWKGPTWHQPLRLRDIPRTEPERECLERLEERLEKIRCAILPPLHRFGLTITSFNQKPNGPQLAMALRELWKDLNVPQRLENWIVEDQSRITIQAGPSVHETVWGQMNEWLDNAELAFPARALSLREWLPILEAGLANLTVGIIPPALDQVLVGAVDRSRTPEIKLAVVVGLNEAVFPALSEPGSLLTESDRAELAKQDVNLGGDSRHQLARERYLGYIACTRARQRLVLTWAAQDPKGAPLNVSSLIARIHQLFPSVRVEEAPQAVDWTDAQHISELIPTLLGAKNFDNTKKAGAVNETFLKLPGLASLAQELRHLHSNQGPDQLPPELAARLYGPVLRTSVSRMEQFAACPFKFFVHSGLRAEERKRFELDIREQGTFQHEALAEFHQMLQAEGKRWRDVTTQEARERIGRIARSRMASYRQGLFESDDKARFTARVLASSLQDFVETVIEWMRHQYEFDPAQVELAFGEDGGAPSWKLALNSEKTLELRGRIDRVDLCRRGDGQNALGVILDYKSSYKQLEPILITHGLQLQLLSYLNVLRHWPNPQATFGVDRVEPAGVFYVNLRGKYNRELNRSDALAQPDQDRRLAYRHSGRFDVSALRYLDSRRDAREGDQFNFRLTRGGQMMRNCREAVDATEFQALLAEIEEHLKRMGREIYSGQAQVVPYRKGLITACDQCGYQAICRIDPWTHEFRMLRPAPKPGKAQVVTGEADDGQVDDEQAPELM